jgi:alpha-L-fucosidase
MIINFKSSIQRELDGFFKAISKSDFKIREVTKGAFSQARAKLNPWAFKRLNEVVVNSFYEGAEYYTWYGMRTLSVDGTRLVLPNHPSVIEEFGQHNFGPNADSPRSLDQCLQSLVRSAGGDGNLLFNVGPMADGQIEPLQVDRLKEMGQWLQKHGNAIFLEWKSRVAVWLMAEKSN